MEINEFCNDMILIEENAKEFYENLSEICEERIRESVLLFARQEEEHKEIIKELFNNIINIKVELSEDIKHIINEQIDFINNNKGVNFGKEKDFFNFAFEIEQKSIEAYSKIINVFQVDSKEFNLFNNLIEEEKKHMIYILKRIHEIK